MVPSVSLLEETEAGGADPSGLEGNITYFCDILGGGCAELVEDAGRGEEIAGKDVCRGFEVISNGERSISAGRDGCEKVAKEDMAELVRHGEAATLGRFGILINDIELPFLLHGHSALALF